MDPLRNENESAFAASRVPSREALLHALYEAAELEHTLMCTYLYAVFSMRRGEAEGLSPDEAEAVARWRSVVMQIAIDEMSHLTAVWNGAVPGHALPLRRFEEQTLL